MAYIEQKAKTGKGTPATMKSAPTGGGKVLDLMALLRKSVEQGKRTTKGASAKRSPTKKSATARKRAPLKLRATKKAAQKKAAQKRRSA